MDPVTAFSLAAGVIQVIDLSSKARSKCREIHKDGSLAQNRATEEITEYLATTTKHLEGSVHHASISSSKESEDIIDVSQKCSETAAKLLSELRKLKCDAGGGACHALALGVRTIRRKKFLAESQERLQKYQSILDTRILVKLDAQSILQNVQLQTIDQNVKDLALALSQGRNTVVQLLSEQTVALREHIDRRFDDQAQRDAIEKAKQQLKSSLFFPEIFARQDNITRSHEGTCHWIFDPRPVRPGPYSDEPVPNPLAYSEDDDGDYGGRPWPDFAQWLVQGGDVYWFSGSPGSGKSTLMEYISRELRGFCRSKDTLNKWDTEGNLVICSFFFWKLGSSLQKDYAALLRSMLYQIAEQREDIVPILMGRHTTLESKPGEAHWSARIYAWTKERLDDAMRRFIVNKPASIRLCLVVDGLDEYVGDEEFLLETVKYLSRDPGTRICVSSRREQIFRLGFANSPQLRLHDLNRHDIEKATRERLSPILEHYFPNSTKETDDLIRSVTYRSEGVFLWADLMCKDIRSGVRNSDSMQELLERLDRTPGDIQGLYEHMLRRMDNSYIQEAAGYFRLLLAEQSTSFLGLTVLHVACGQEAAWKCVLKKDFAHFQSLEFRDSCRKLETRILTRCAGLVEIAERRNEFLNELYDATEPRESVEASQARDNVSRYLCYVDFIHRTVAESLESHEQFFQEPDWEWTARLAICRGSIGVMSLVPTMSEANVRCHSLGIQLFCLRGIMAEILLTENRFPLQTHRQASHDDLFQLIDQLYDVAHYVYASFNGPDRTLSESYGDDHIPFERRSTIKYHLPLQDRLGFAAHFGCYEYVSHYMSVNNVSGIYLDHILFCANVGLDDCHFGGLYEGLRLQLASTIGWLRIILSCLSYSDCSEVYFPKHFFTRSDTQITKWGLFILCSTKVFDYWGNGEEQNSTSPHARELYQQSSRICRLWKDIVAYFLKNHKPDDTPFLLRRRAPLKIEGYSDSAESMGVWFCLEETVLAWTKRTFSLADPEFMEDITALLESHGKLDRSSFRSIDILVDWRSPFLKVLPLTDSQSEILTNAWSTVKLVPRADPLMRTPDEEPRPVKSDAETEKLMRMILHVFKERKSDTSQKCFAKMFRH